VPKECDRLILIPHRFLHILPLHTLPVSPQIDRRARGEGKYILDLFPRGIQYAPSCQLLKLAQSQQRPDFRNLFAIQNPTGDLVYTDLEVETIRSFLPSCEVLARQAATEEAVKNYQNFPSIHCGHFCCHGEFNPISPLESALILADKEHWTLGEIFELSIPQCRLITLSACETGFTDPNSLCDEYIGLPSGFLFAGSPSVVSSLWTVDDLSTSFLMIKFYEILFNANLNISVAVALKEAQDWLQNLTVKEIEENLAKPTFQQAFSQLQQTLSSGDLFELEDAIASKKNKWKTMSSDEKPFSNPFYWAAFVATGV
jgi:CHAT domain-containing protein